MRKTAFYFLSLALLIAGICLLNAQEDEETADKNQPAPAAPSTTVEVKEVSAEKDGAVGTSQAVTVSESSTTQVTATAAVDSTAQAKPEATVVVETDAAAAPRSDAKADQPMEVKEKSPAEGNATEAKPETTATVEPTAAVTPQTDTKVEPMEAKEKSTAESDKGEAKPEATVVVEPKAAVAPLVEPSAEKKENKDGQEISRDVKTESFEIDRGGKTSEKTAAPESAKDAPSAAAQPAVEGQKKSRGFFGRLFGSSKEKKQEGEGAELKSGQQPDAQAPVAAAQGKSAGKGLTPEELLAAQEEVRRQAKEVEGLKKLDQAYQEMSRKEFDKALTHFNEALSIMPLRPHTVETRQKAMMSEAECEYRLALNNYQEGKIKEAREGIRRALEYSPGHRGAARLSERIKQDETDRAQVEATPVPLRKAPAYLDKKKKVKSEIQRGREYMAIKEYNDAENEFRSVLADEKLNSEASANLKKIAETRYNLETDEFQRMKAEMLAQVIDTWTPPVKRAATGPRTEAQETIIASQARRRLENKLKNIMIQKVDFVDAKIEDVVTFLHQQSLQDDKESAPGEKGVNILLRLNRPGQSAAPAAAATDVFAAEEAKPVASSASGVQAITMTMRDISLMDAIKYITDIAGLKYRIEERVVIIHSPDVALGELETKTYKVLPATIDVMTGGGGGAMTTTEAGADKMEIGQTKVATTERTDIKQFLVNAGIPFPENTTVSYIQAPPTLIIKNTPENLEKFETLLTTINVPTILVAIEARFVEIAQTDLEELGLEWLLTDNWELATKPNGERIQMNKNNMTKGLRELNVTGGQIGTAVGGNMGSIAAISSILTNPELTVVLHALQQKDGANLLSAPKVTTKSGANAKIKVVEELIYPTEYQQNIQSLGTTSSGNQSVTKIVVTPSAFETRDLGVILDVTPTVNPDNETIDLVMLPQVVELARWIDYGSAQPTGDGNNTQWVPLNQPVFHCRDITTSISIWDGQTVVMGGLITEGQQNTEDKVPLLGDIPLLGYLFRSTTSKSIKKNLLIFVTANLVDPAGNKIKKDSGASLSAAGSTP